MFDKKKYKYWNIISPISITLTDAYKYLEEHPEVKGIEFEGEIRTAEELDEIMIDRLSKLYEED